MNKNLLIITYAVLVAIALIGTLLLLVVAPEHFGTFTGFVLVLLGLVVTTAANFWSLGKAKQEIRDVKEETSTKLDVVQKQTNGTLTKLIRRNHELADQNRKKEAENAELRAMLNMPALKGTQND